MDLGPVDAVRSEGVRSEEPPAMPATRPWRPGRNDQVATSKRVRVVVADDHPLFREAIVRAVRERPDLELVGEASSGREALELVRAEKPDVAVLDLKMPE